jgi:hypothetical protein
MIQQHGTAQELEQELITMLHQLPISITITHIEPLGYRWEWQRSHGIKPSLVGAVREALAEAMNALGATTLAEQKDSPRNTDVPSDFVSPDRSLP